MWMIFLSTSGFHLTGAVLHQVVADGDDEVGLHEQVGDLAVLAEADGADAAVALRRDGPLAHEGGHDGNAEESRRIS